MCCMSWLRITCETFNNALLVITHWSKDLGITSKAQLISHSHWTCNPLDSFKSSAYCKTSLVELYKNMSPARIAEWRIMLSSICFTRRLSACYIVLNHLKDTWRSATSTRQTNAGYGRVMSSQAVQNFLSHLKEVHLHTRQLIVVKYWLRDIVLYVKDWYEGISDLFEMTRQI